MSGVAEKLCGVGEAADLVRPGAILGIGGVMEQMVPVTFLLELVRRELRGLHCVGIAAGISMDMMVTSRLAERISCAIVSYESLGPALGMRRRVEAGETTFDEYSELLLITRLQAAGAGLTFLPTRAAIGTEMVEQLPDDAVIPSQCPFTGARFHACRALAPDVTVIHAARADRLGNVQLDSKHIWHDLVLARAARAVVVTVEEIVATEAIREAPEKTVLPAFLVDRVVHAPQGARPTEFRGRYGTRLDELAAWREAAADDEAAERLLEEWAAARLGPIGGEGGSGV